MRDEDLRPEDPDEFDDSLAPEVPPLSPPEEESRDDPVEGLNGFSQ